MEISERLKRYSRAAERRKESWVQKRKGASPHASSLAGRETRGDRLPQAEAFLSRVARGSPPL